MFSWILNIPLIFKLFGGKLRRSLFHVKINLQLTHSSRGSCQYCNIYKYLLKVNFFVHFYSLRSLNQRATVSSILQYQSSQQLHLLQVESCPFTLNKGQTPAKTFIIHFHLHFLTNKQWLADFKILYISSSPWSPFCRNRP